jgi:hypothetical protein
MIASIVGDDPRRRDTAAMATFFAKSDAYLTARRRMGTSFSPSVAGACTADTAGLSSPSSAQ